MLHIENIKLLLILPLTILMFYHSSPELFSEEMKPDTQVLTVSKNIELSLEEEELVHEIEELEEKIYKHYDVETEKKLALVYLKYSKFLVQENHFQEAKEYLDIAKGLGVNQEKAKEISMLLEEKQPVEMKNNVISHLLPDGKERVSRKFQPTDNFIFRRNVVYALFEQAGSFYEAKNYELAKTPTKKILEYEPNNKLANELLGNIHYQLQELKEAEFYWEKAVSRDSLDRINKKRSKLKKELPLEEGLLSVEEEHFKIRYASSNQQYTSYDLKLLLREAYKEIYQDFSTPLKGKIVVLMYEKKDFENKIRSSHLTGALFDGKIRMPFLNKQRGSEREMKRLIWHELTHAFIYNYAGDKVPLWLNEGVAQYYENKVIPIQLRFFWTTYRRNKLLNLRGLSLGEKIFKNTETTTLFYQQSFVFVDYLIERFGFYKVRELLKELGKEENVDSAFLKVFSLSAKEVERRWLKWLEGK